MRGILRLIRQQTLGFVALCVALGGVSYAAATLPAGSVNTRQLHNGAVTRPKLDKRLLASLRKAAGTPGPAGPQGAQGAKGDQGAPGADGRDGAAGPGAIPFRMTVPVTDATTYSAVPWTTVKTLGPVLLQARCWHNTGGSVAGMPADALRIAIGLTSTTAPINASGQSLVAFDGVTGSPSVLSTRAQLSTEIVTLAQPGHAVQMLIAPYFFQVTGTAGPATYDLTVDAEADDTTATRTCLAAGTAVPATA